MLSRGRGGRLDVYFVDIKITLKRESTIAYNIGDLKNGYLQIHHVFFYNYKNTMF